MKLSNGEKKMLAFSVVAIALPLGVGLFWTFINATPKTNIPAYPAAPTPNGTDIYVLAEQAMKPANPPVDGFVDATKITDPKIRAQRYSLARKTAWLKQNKQAFDLFDKAQQTPALAPPDRDLFATVPSQKLLRGLARRKLVQSNARWMRGDAEGALQSGLEIVKMGHQMRRGGDLLAVFNGRVAGAIGRLGMHDVVERVSATKAKAAARELELLLDMRWNLDQSLTEEKYSAQSELLQFFKTKSWRSVLPIWGRAPLNSVVGAHFISKQRLLDDTGTLFDQHIAAARTPYTQAQTKKIVPPNPYLGLHEVVLEGHRFSDARDLVGDQALMLRLALRAYRLENGAYPLDLQTLTPRYLKAIPADPIRRR